MRKILAALFTLSVLACTPTATTTPDSSDSVQAPATSVGSANSASLGKSSQDFTQLVSASACSKRFWPGRDVMSEGAIEGMARAYHRDLCRYLGPDTTVAGLIGKAPGTSTSDALAWLAIYPGETGPERLKRTFVLGIGLMARESEGKYCTGRDTSATNYSADTCEAGPFQASYNSRSASPDRLAGLWTWFKAHPEACDLDVWSRGVDKNATANWNCRTPVGGSGVGADWQTFTRACPAFAAEWAMVLVRIMRQHFGPLNRKEAEYNDDCKLLLDQVEKLPCT